MTADRQGACAAFLVGFPALSPVRAPVLIQQHARPAFSACFTPFQRPLSGCNTLVRRDHHTTEVSFPRAQSGFTLLELLVIMAILGILFALGGYSYLSTRNPPRDAARTVHAALLTLRSQAMSNTQARRILLVDDQNLILQSALKCSETDQSKWTQIGTVPLDSGARPLTLSTLKAPGDAVTPDTYKVSCFTPRGLAEKAGSLGISDGKRAYLISVALGGGVKTDAATP